VRPQLQIELRRHGNEILKLKRMFTTTLDIHYDVVEHDTVLAGALDHRDQGTQRERVPARWGMADVFGERRVPVLVNNPVLDEVITLSRANADLVSRNRGKRDPRDL